MELPEYAKILGRLGDPSTPRPDSHPGSTEPMPPGAAPDLGDIVVQLSNGAKITGAELIERELAEEGLVMIVDRVKGPVDLHRTQRLASDKQRIMAIGEQPTCAWDECLCGADYAQIHHITEWKDGGETNPENLTPLCKYHNAINGLPGRGRIVRENGRIRWQPPGPRDPREPFHPHRAPRAQRLPDAEDTTGQTSAGSTASPDATGGSRRAFPSGPAPPRGDP